MIHHLAVGLHPDDTGASRRLPQHDADRILDPVLPNTAISPDGFIGGPGGDDMGLYDRCRVRAATSSSASPRRTPG
jgi:hypothetical protein